MTGGLLDHAADAVLRSDVRVRRGLVANLIGLVIEATGLRASIGEVCVVSCGRNQAPITAEGLRANAFCPQGRLAQSIAFLSPPGMERLYSGVTNSTASTSAMACLKARATGGKSAS